MKNTGNSQSILCFGWFLCHSPEKFWNSVRLKDRKKKGKKDERRQWFNTEIWEKLESSLKESVWIKCDSSTPSHPHVKETFRQKYKKLFFNGFTVKNKSMRPSLAWENGRIFHHNDDHVPEFHTHVWSTTILSEFIRIEKCARHGHVERFGRFLRLASVNKFKMNFMRQKYKPLCLCQLTNG